LHGYAEYEMYSMHIDTLLVMSAHYGRIPERVLNDPMRIYHIEHGAGWTPEGESQLEARLDAAGIPYLTSHDAAMLARKMARARKPLITNGKNWGLAGKSLVETKI